MCTAAGHVAFLRSEYDAARALLEEGLTLSRAAADSPGVVQALLNLALVAMTQADTTPAHHCRRACRSPAHSLTMQAWH